MLWLAEILTCLSSDARLSITINVIPTSGWMNKYCRKFIEIIQFKIIWGMSNWCKDQNQSPAKSYWRMLCLHDFIVLHQRNPQLSVAHLSVKHEQTSLCLSLRDEWEKCECLNIGLLTAGSSRDRLYRWGHIPVSLLSVTLTINARSFTFLFFSKLYFRKSFF